MSKDSAKLVLVGIVGIMLFALGATARADQQADALVKEVMRAAKAVKTLSADIRVNSDYQRQQIHQQIHIKGSIKLRMPNLVHLDMNGHTLRTLASDGKTAWVLMANNQFRTMPATMQNVARAASGPCLPAGILLDPASFDKAMQETKNVKVRLLASETVEGINYRVIEMTNSPMTMKLYVAPNKLVLRIVMDTKQGAESSRMETVLRNVKVNPPLSTSAFVYKPPRNATHF